VKQNVCFRHNRTLAVSCALLLFGALLSPTSAEAAIVRGRLIRVASNGAQFPAVGIAVTLYAPNIGRSSPSYTDGIGMYYLTARAGNYTLEVWVSRDPRVSPAVYQILIQEPNTDIPQIVVP
jgi:hypothetical protein